MEDFESYGELLLKPQWKSKRSQILDANNFCCFRCLNQGIFQDCSEGSIVDLSSASNMILDSFDGNKMILAKIWKIRFKDREGNINEATFYSRILANLVDKNNIVYYKKSQDDEKIIVQAIRSSDKKKWIYARDLHIHHTYYKFGLKPWEYPDDSLEVLCWNCHEELHEKESVPILNEKDQIVGQLTLCKKCHGIGWFPQYTHIDNGRCFRCGGLRYEEFIEKTNLDL